MFKERKRAAGGLVVLLCLAGLGLWAETPEEARAKRVQNRFMAPCCWSESVAVHRSEIAATMRVEIERMLREGKTEQEIEARYVAEYGERILVEPRGTKRWWLLVIPVVVLGAGLFGLTRYLARRRRQAEPAPAGPGVPVADEELEW